MASSDSTSPPVTPLHLSVTWVNTTIAGFQTPAMTTTKLIEPPVTPRPVIRHTWRDEVGIAMSDYLSSMLSHCHPLKEPSFNNPNTISNGNRTEAVSTSHDLICLCGERIVRYMPQKIPARSTTARWRRKPAPHKKGPCFGYIKFLQRKKTICYRLHNEVGQPATWTKANERCTSEGARLAIVKSMEQFKALKTILKKGAGNIIAIFQRKLNRKIWIGLRQEKWVDGTKASRGIRQDLCAALDFGPPFKSNFYNCKMDNFFVCEKEIKSESGLMTN